VKTHTDNRIYLASRSPRRRELLRQIGIAFEILLMREEPRRGVDVDAEDLVPQLGHAGGVDGTEVAGADNGHPHSGPFQEMRHRNPLVMREERLLPLWRSLRGVRVSHGSRRWIVVQTVAHLVPHKWE